MTTFAITRLTFLSIIGAIYLGAGLSLLFYIGIVRVTPWRVPLPVIRTRWDRHGFVDIVIGFAHGISDQMIQWGMMQH